MVKSQWSIDGAKQRRAFTDVAVDDVAHNVIAAAAAAVEDDENDDDNDDGGDDDENDDDDDSLNHPSPP